MKRLAAIIGGSFGALCLLAAIPGLLVIVLLSSIFGFHGGAFDTSSSSFSPVWDEVSAEAILFGIDTATTLSEEQIALFAADPKISFIGRYLAPSSYPKALKMDEAKAISKAGLQLYVYYEMGATDPLEGAPKGTEHGKNAYKCAKEIGLPSNAIIYFAVDCGYPDTSPAGMAKYNALVADYMKAARAETGEYEIGIYASYPIIEYAIDNTPCIAYCQCYGGSGSYLSSEYTIYQGSSTTTMYGVGVDVCACRDPSKAGFFTIE